MPNNRPICVVDDDEATRDALVWLFSTRDHEAVAFESGEAFLADYHPDKFGCIVLDVRMPGISGLEVFEQLKTHSYQPPVIFLTGHGDVPMAVGALKGGAADFIQKPFNDNQLVDMTERCLAEDEQARTRWAAKQSIETRLGHLTPREREVMKLIIAGKLNKVIADELDISMKTVEVHRARILEKMGVKTAVELASLLGGTET
ncbi:response regulator [Chitinivorax sp. B]|uniref:response regulator transcription factor n=1 Tax=Chitinivorax sp. B TaxID=2502235 RepID=UPI0010F6565B|nr:response regulator [Chitinivorax sp. B]